MKRETLCPAVSSWLLRVSLMVWIQCFCTPRDAWLTAGQEVGDLEAEMPGSHLVCAQD